MGRLLPKLSGGKDKKAKLPKQKLREASVVARGQGYANSMKPGSPSRPHPQQGGTWLRAGSQVGRWQFTPRLRLNFSKAPFSWLSNGEYQS